MTRDRATGERATGERATGERATGGTGTGGRTAQLLAWARAAKGFMPDDEGLALYEAARRAGAERPATGTFVEIGAWCGKSTRLPGSRRRGHRGRALQHRPPPRVGGEPGRLGPPRPRRRRPRHRAHRHAAVLAARPSTGPGLGASVVGVVGDSPTIAERWRTPLDLCFIDGGHGAEPAWADFRRLDAAHRPGRLAGHPRRVPRSRRRRAPPLRAVERGAGVGPVRRGRRLRVAAPAQACGARARLGEVEPVGKRLAPEQARRRRGVRQRVGGQDDGCRRCKSCAPRTGTSRARGRRSPSSTSRRRNGAPGSR